MNAFLLYVVQSGLCLSLFYGLYLLLLRREAFFRFNRNILLGIMLTSMAIPLIRVPVAEPALIQLPVMQLEETLTKVQSSKFKVSSWENSENMSFTKFAEEEPETLNLKPETLNLIPLAYLAGFFISLALAFVSFVSVARIIVTARRVVYRQQRILVSPLKINSFNFAGWIVLSETDYERFAAEIVTHETIHRRSGHFWDLCLVNAIAVVHWFNPLVGLLRREVKTQHEYETDRCTLTQGINATRYQLLLIEKAAGASRYSVASGFAQSKIKKRIVMMNKQNHNPQARWKALLFIPLAALLTLAFARPEIKRELEQISTLKSTEILQESNVSSAEIGISMYSDDNFVEKMGIPEKKDAVLINERRSEGRDVKAQNTDDPQSTNSSAGNNVIYLKVKVRGSDSVFRDFPPLGVSITERKQEEVVENKTQQGNEFQHNEDIVIPNVFKPNLENEPSNVISEISNKNNLFFPTSLTNTCKYHFLIFNRWGKLLFETTDPNRGWNGYFEGRLCDEGVYYYKVEGVFENGQPFSKIGYVTLLKTPPHTAQLPTEKEWELCCCDDE